MQKIFIIFLFITISNVWTVHAAPGGKGKQPSKSLQGLPASQDGLNNTSSLVNHPSNDSDIGNISRPETEKKDGCDSLIHFRGDPQRPVCTKSNHLHSNSNTVDTGEGSSSAAQHSNQSFDVIRNATNQPGSSDENENSQQTRTQRILGLFPDNHKVDQAQQNESEADLIQQPAAKRKPLSAEPYREQNNYPRSSDDDVQYLTTTLKHPEFKDKARRLESYKTWSSDDSHMIKNLVEAGYHLTKDNKIECYHCGARIKSLMANDCPWIKHVETNPACDRVLSNMGPFFINLVRSKICIDVTDPICNNEKGSTVDPSKNDRPSQQSHRNEDNLKYLRAKQQETPPKYPQYEKYADVGDRVESYKSKPINLPLKPQEFAGAGFFPMEDDSHNLSCFYCGVQCDMKKTDDPWIQHAIHSPKCPFLHMEMGPFFVNVVWTLINKDVPNITRKAVIKEALRIARNMKDYQQFFSINSDDHQSEATLMQYPLQDDINAKLTFNVLFKMIQKFAYTSEFVNENQRFKALKVLLEAQTKDCNIMMLAKAGFFPAKGYNGFQCHSCRGLIDENENVILSVLRHISSFYHKCPWSRYIIGKGVAEAIRSTTPDSLTLEAVIQEMERLGYAVPNPQGQGILKLYRPEYINYEPSIYQRNESLTFLTDYGPKTSFDEKFKSVCSSAMCYHYTKESDRRSSFSDTHFPKQGNFLTADIFAMSGFYWKEQYKKARSDCLNCAFCGKRIYAWGIDDNPILEHLRFYPECPWLNLILGQEVTSAAKEVAIWQEHFTVEAVIEEMECHGHKIPNPEGEGFYKLLKPEFIAYRLSQSQQNASAATLIQPSPEEENNSESLSVVQSETMKESGVVPETYQTS